MAVDRAGLAEGVVAGLIEHLKFEGEDFAEALLLLGRGEWRKGAQPNARRPWYEYGSLSPPGGGCFPTAIRCPNAI